MKDVLDFQGRNGQAPAKGKRKAKRSGAVSKSKRQALRNVELWAGRYVGGAVALSAGLNAWANVDLCGAASLTGQCAAAGIGLAVPGLVWVAGKIAGWSHRAGRLSLAWLVGVAGVCLLLLSVWHCAHAIDHLTGCGLGLAILQAVGIDYGLVASEVAAIVAHEDEK
jgi:hypothetical protein